MVRFEHEALASALAETLDRISKIDAEVDAMAHLLDGAVNNLVRVHGLTGRGAVIDVKAKNIN